MESKIYIATHKEYNFPQEECYIPIHVGKFYNQSSLGIIDDYSGDNISYLNKNFCELTGHYWVWKNVKSDYYGLVHYRRYFTTEDNSLIFRGVNLLTNKEIQRDMKSYDVILPIKEFVKIYKIPVKVKYQYGYFHKSNDWKELRNLISSDFPDYIDSFDAVSESFSLSCYNMFIMKRDVFLKYSSWLFGVLFEYSSRKDLSGYDQYQSRIYGFLSERLLNVFFHKHKDEYSIKYNHVKKINEGK